MKLKLNQTVLSQLFIVLGFVQLVFPNKITWFLVSSYFVCFIIAFISFVVYSVYSIKHGISKERYFEILKSRIACSDICTINKTTIAGYVVYGLILLSFGQAGYTGTLYALAVISMLIDLTIRVVSYRIKNS